MCLYIAVSSRLFIFLNIMCSVQLHNPINQNSTAKVFSFEVSISTHHRAEILFF